MNTDQIREELFHLRDEPYGDFQGKLLPTVDRFMVTPRMLSLVC